MSYRPVPAKAAGGAPIPSRFAGWVPPLPSGAFARRVVSFALLAACAFPLQAKASARPAQAPSANPAAADSSSGGAPSTRAVPTLIYTRTLVGSTPEYVRVTVHQDGSGSYEGRRLSDPPNPRVLQLNPALTQKLFALAGDLNDFRSLRLENHRAKVANLGRKTFVYENGAERNEVEFNFTQQKQAMGLMEQFDGIALAELHVGLIEYSLKYDPLGLPEELRRIQMDLGEKALADPGLLVPSLERVVKDPRLLHLAQVRAQEILNSVAEGRGGHGERR